YAYVTDITDEKNRAKGMGLVGAAFGLGLIFGPAIGGLLSQWGYSTPMFFGAGLSLLNFVFAYFFLKEPALSAEARAAHRHKRFDLASIREVLKPLRTRHSITVFFWLTFAVTQMEVTFALYMADQYSYNARQAGML